MKGSQFELLQRYVTEIETTVQKAISCGRLNDTDVKTVCSEIERVRKLTAHIDSQIKSLGLKVDRPVPEPLFDEEDVIELRKTA